MLFLDCLWVYDFSLWHPFNQILWCPATCCLPIRPHLKLFPQLPSIGLNSSLWRGSPPGWGISSPLEDLISSTLVFSTFYLLGLLWVLYSVYFWISLARQYSANHALLGRPRICFFLCRWRVTATTSQVTGGDWMEQDIFWEQWCHNKY